MQGPISSTLYSNPPAVAASIFQQSIPHPRRRHHHPCYCSSNNSKSIIRCNCSKKGMTNAVAACRLAPPTPQCSAVLGGHNMPIIPVQKRKNRVLLAFSNTHVPHKLSQAAAAATHFFRHLQENPSSSNQTTCSAHDLALQLSVTSIHIMSGCVRQISWQPCPRHSRLALSLDTAGAASTEGTGQGKVNVLLAVHPHHEAGDVHHLLAHPGDNHHHHHHNAATMISYIVRECVSVIG